MKTSTTIYYQGTNNNEMLLTDMIYIQDMLEIDQEEYDVQPSISFTVPGSLLNQTSINLTM